MEVICYFCSKFYLLNIARFTLLYLGFCMLLAGLATLLPQLFPNTDLLIDKFWVLFCFLAGITYIAYLTADLGIKKNPEVGVMAIMASITVKMLFSLAFVLIYSMKAQQMGLIFLLNFFSLYLLFSFFEIYFLLKSMK
jgi:hypothetical protein